MAQHTSIPAPPEPGAIGPVLPEARHHRSAGRPRSWGICARTWSTTAQRIDESTYNLSIALAQIMPGPWRRRRRSPSATSRGRAGRHAGRARLHRAVLPHGARPVLAVRDLRGLPWMQALFYGIGAVVIAIIAMAAYRLARGTNKRDPLLWGICGVMLVATVWSQAELAACSSWQACSSCPSGPGLAAPDCCWSQQVPR